jgi:hypothetical protein
LEDEIRALKRRIDEAEFETEKVKKEGEFNINVIKATQNSDAKRIVEESMRVTQKLRETEDDLNRLKADNAQKIAVKDN